jgi:hypothetical protein
MLFLVSSTCIREQVVFTSFLRTFSTSAAASVKKKMPPKKAAVPEKKVILGAKNTNNLSMGFVGVSWEEKVVEEKDFTDGCLSSTAASQCRKVNE